MNDKSLEQMKALKAENNELKNEIKVLKEEMKKLQMFGQTIDEEELKYFKSLAFTDNLTGAFNRHYLNQILYKKYNEKEIFIALSDTNDLKEINDREGHLAGDMALCDLVASLLQFGIVIRWGGDEFLVLSESPIDLNGIYNGHCIATLKKSAEMSLYDAIEEVDQKMYSYKKIYKENKNK